jgi:cytochrome c oxidase subunit 3
MVGATKPHEAAPGTIRGDFGPNFYTPVELVGFYWHFVDLVWIYLFPLLYLVG